MGALLSAFLSEIYMQNYETDYIINNKIYSSYTRYFISRIKSYYNCVDNTFILIRGLNRRAENLVKYLNKIYKNIKFTLQIQINNKFNFLDLTFS
jgi:hypothetical protein